MKVDLNNLLYNTAFTGVKKEPREKKTEPKKNLTPDINSAEIVKTNKSYWDVGLPLHNIKSARFITDTENDIPIARNADGSFTVNKETDTRVYYGKPALELLKQKDFDRDTQVIFPQGSSGVLIKNGKEIKLPMDSAVQITAGTKDAQIKHDKGTKYPFVISSKKDFDWYERFEKNAKSDSIKHKFLELMYFASNVYNAEFTPNLMLPRNLKDEKNLEMIGINKKTARNTLVDQLYSKRHMLSKEDREEVTLIKGITDKLISTGMGERLHDNYLRVKVRYAPWYQEQELEKAGFTREEIDKVLPVLTRARQAKIDSKLARRNRAEGYGEEIVKKMKQAGIIYNNKKGTEYIYWRNILGNEDQVKSALYNAKDKDGKRVHFSPEEVDRVVYNWHVENISGYDMSGMKYIDEDLAVYNLADKINNWTQEETNWATNSTAISTTKKDVPSVGVSLVRCEIPGIRSMNALRMGEALHKHPNEEKLKQYEVYFVTHGQEVLDVRKDGQIHEVVLNAGDLAVVMPSVEHCVNVVRGTYEHICAQVPSAFHHGFGLKQPVPDNEDKAHKFERGKKALEDLEETQEQKGN